MVSAHSNFREQLMKREGLLVPGAANALAALVIADLGYEAIYLSGAGLTNTFLGLPDLAFISLPELVQHTMAIKAATDLPLIVDADTGFGNALNVRHTVQSLERAGADVVQLEDQVSPKKCGHFSGKEVIPAEEMAGKIRAAVDARRSRETLIMARTDARAVEGFERAVERAQLYEQSGADIIFVEAPESIQEMESLPQLIAAPLLINIVVGGKTPVVSQERLAQMGFALVLYANVALQSAIKGMQSALGQLKERGELDETGPVASFRERQRLVRKPEFDALEKRYSAI
ncbi:isocitrate lyase/phosphoenolpyruvate mutase family protein [Bosea sp. UNC402CLCol]|uniref:isocitrate lyase/PEP mutase family protein n=1 Tax=Bosea sp. UNC402CLCol TaxID=1510531 RepID=UPI000571DC57|nr:isocitrate lyase/phosphoenolpyruvate mutase family protein [Bosea sp. UNC402CLCol]